MEKETDHKVSPTSLRMQAKLIDAVVEVVAEHGISGLTFANVAATAGVSQGSLVFHFKTREGLLSETLKRLLAEYVQAFETVMEMTDPLDRIVGFVGLEFDPKIFTPKKLNLWFAFLGETGAQAFYNDVIAEFEEKRLKSIAQTCKQLSDVSSAADPDMLAYCIDSLARGFMQKVHISPHLFSREKAKMISLAHLRLLLPLYATRIK